MSAPLPWQTSQWEAVSGARAAGRLHHALLAAGPPGVGKADFLAALCCARRPAARNPAANAAAAGNMPPAATRTASC